ncbi:MAG: glycosyltransferase [Pseudomonadota bacterium]
MSVTLVVGALAPYTHRLFEAVAERLPVPLHVLTCTGIEPHRQWQFPTPKNYQKHELSGLKWHRSYHSHAYFNPGVINQLHTLDPQVVCIGGFSPTMMLAGAWARATNRRRGLTTDGRRDMDPGERSYVHWAMRKLIVPRAHFGIAASQESAALLAQYGLETTKSAITPIVVPWDPPAPLPGYDERPFDLHFCGALRDYPKGSIFFARTVAKLQEDRIAAGDTTPVKVRITGDGPDRAQMETMLQDAGVEAQFDGFLNGADLRAAYSSAKVFAFPSRGDPWGLVANEAIQCGTPVLGSVHATSSAELVTPYEVGQVRPLRDDQWVTAMHTMLDDRATWEEMHARCVRAARTFTVDTSARAMSNALIAQLNRPARSPRPVHAPRDTAAVKSEGSTAVPAPRLHS